MKWVLIVIGALVVLQLLNSRNQASGATSGIIGSTSKAGAGGVVDSLTHLTDSIGRLFGRGGTTVKDRDGLITPTF